MPAVVVYDPDGVLPSSFASDTGLGAAASIVETPSDAHRLGRDARVMVLVAGQDSSAALGLLASSGARCTTRLVLFATDARHHRRLLIRAVRHDALVLVAQPVARLRACIRDLLALPPSRM